MRKGLILINAYSTLSSSLNQSNRLKEELEKLDVSVDIRNNNYFEAMVSDNDIVRKSNYDFCIYLDKDKYVSEMLEHTGMRLFNSHEAILDCDDKMCTYIKLSGRNLNLVDTMPGLLCYTPDAIISDATVDEIESRFGYPVIVKECYGSLGKGVYKCDNRDELKEIMEKLKTIPHLFQRFVSTSQGRDIRVIVVGDTCVAAMVRESKIDFRSNIELGGKGTPIEINDEIKEQALGATRALKLDYAGIDLLFGEDGKLIICEVNSNAFFGGIESVTHVNVAKAYAEYIVDSVYVDTSILKENVNHISITNLAIDRCNKNLKANFTHEQIMDISRRIILNDSANILKKGKNWYVDDGKIRFTINSQTYMIITANKLA